MSETGCDRDRVEVGAVWLGPFLTNGENGYICSKKARMALLTVKMSQNIYKMSGMSKMPKIGT